VIAQVMGVCTRDYQHQGGVAWHVVEAQGNAMDTSASLLERLSSQPDDASWQRLDGLYRPLVRRWLLREPNVRNDVDDLVQEVMTVLVRELPGFRRQRSGSFRRWLRTITAHRLQGYLRARQRTTAECQSLAESSFADQLADPRSELSRQWDEEHNAHVISRLLGLIEGDFAAATLLAFRRVVFDEAKPACVAAELGISVNAVLVAKSKVLSRLRQEAEGLLD
jgi:RNA polymerase sigma-70 factor (ECF subfamily)